MKNIWIQAPSANGKYLFLTKEKIKRRKERVNRDKLFVALTKIDHHSYDFRVNKFPNKFAHFSPYTYVTFGRRHRRLGVWCSYTLNIIEWKRHSIRNVIIVVFLLQFIWDVVGRVKKKKKNHSISLYSFSLFEFIQKNSSCCAFQWNNWFRKFYKLSVILKKFFIFSVLKGK